MSKTLDQLNNIWLFPDWVDGAETPKAPHENSESQPPEKPRPPETSHPPGKLQPPVNPRSLEKPKPPEKPQTPEIKTPENAVAVTEKTQLIGREAPSVDADEAVAEETMTFGLPKAVVLTPEVETLIADVEQEAAAIGADAETEPELQEQLALVRAEASFVKRLVDLKKEERRILSELRRVQKFRAGKTGG